MDCKLAGMIGPCEWIHEGQCTAPPGKCDASPDFGGLPVLPKSEQPVAGAYSPSCYICRDPSFKAMGLPLCRRCRFCGGHIAADDVVCDDCGRDGSEDIIEG